MKKNLIKSWKTTLIGFIIIIASIISVFKIPSINWADASIPLTIGIALLFSPDTALNKISSVFTKKA
jgi:hypothetical protein